jgi:arginase
MLDKSIQTQPIITLGGDHSIGHSSVSSSLNKYADDLLVIWIDAHADINTHDSSLSKNTHGMPVSGLVGLEPNWINDKIPILKPSNLVYFGIRDLDSAEVEFISKLGIRHFNNISNLTTYLDSIGLTNKKVHISFDIDSLDPVYLDSTGTIASDGLSPRSVVELYNYVKEKTQIVALDVVELNPELGDLSKSIYTLEYILSNILGNSYHISRLV